VAFIELSNRIDLVGFRGGVKRYSWFGYYSHTTQLDIDICRQRVDPYIHLFPISYLLTPVYTSTFEMLILVSSGIHIDIVISKV